MQNRMLFFKSIFKKSQLKENLSNLLPKQIERFKEYRKKYGALESSNLTVNNVLEGCKNVPALFYEGSIIDSRTGILLKGYTFQEIKDFLPKADEGADFETYEPLPENLVWLLLTGEFPSQEEANNLRTELNERATISPEILEFIKKMPKEASTTVQLSNCLLQLQRNSAFAKGYREGINKSLYWELYYEDALDIIAKIPRLAAYIYRHKFKNDEFIHPNEKLDYAGNFAHMLGINTPEGREMMRGYLSVFSDHAGNNACAHASMIVASALGDPYLAYSAGLNSLTGCFYGSYQQAALNWLLNLQKNLGDKPTDDKIKEFIMHEISDKRKIPGYMSDELSHIDPRFLHQKAFAERYIKSEPLIYLMKRLYRVTPGLLRTMNKTVNPWPNVEASCGALLYCFGIREPEYFSTIFGVSRSIGVCSNMILAKAFGLPIERPGSVTMEMIETIGKKKKNQQKTGGTPVQNK